MRIIEINPLLVGYVLVLTGVHAAVLGKTPTGTHGMGPELNSLAQPQALGALG